MYLKDVALGEVLSESDGHFCRSGDVSGTREVTQEVWARRLVRELGRSVVFLQTALAELAEPEEEGQVEDAHGFPFEPPGGRFA